MNWFLYVLVIALAMDALFGDPHSSIHPVALFGRAAGAVESVSRRIFGSSVTAGVIGWLFLIIPAGIVAWGTTRFAQCAGPLPAVLVAAFWLYVTIALRSLIDHAEAIRRPLAAGDLITARRMLSRIVSRDTTELPESEVVRGAVESLGENLVDAVTSALFWAALGFLAGGLPGLAAGAVVLRAVNTLDACWGYRNDRYLRFGRVAARSDDFAHWLPARLTVVAIALAAQFSGGGFRRTLAAGIRHRHDHPSPNSAWSMAAFAGALKIRLGGPTVYDGEVEPYPPLGNGRAELAADDLFRAELLTVSSALFFVLFIVAGVCLCWKNCF